MQSRNSARRHFLQQLGGVAGVAWLNAQWPSIAAAAKHAHHAMQTPRPSHFDVLSASEAKEVAAIAARIIPTDEDPGATEAGVVYFIDRALKTFASEDLPTYKSGLDEFNHATSEMFPGVKFFSSATSEQQDKVLAEISNQQKLPERSRPSRANRSVEFFQTVWSHTMMGFLAAPEAGGNRDYVGWKLIGRDPAHTFSPPFGEYDKNYPGWHADGVSETEKK